MAVKISWLTIRMWVPADNAMYRLQFQVPCFHAIYSIPRLDRIRRRYVQIHTIYSIGMKPSLASKSLDWWGGSGERLLSRGVAFLLCLTAAFLGWSSIPHASAGRMKDVVPPHPIASHLRTMATSPASTHLFG